MVAPNKEYIEYEIRLNARQAMTELEKLATSTTTYGKRIDETKKAINKLAKDMGISFKEAKSQMMEADRVLSATSKGSVLFGNKSKEMWDKVTDGSKKATKAFDGMRIAMSIFAYDLVRNGLQAVQQFFTQAIDQARQLEASLYRLQNAERILSKGGIDVTMGGLRKGIQDIKKLLPIFSQEDITQTVGALAVSTKQLGLTEEQILGLARAAAIYNVQSVENETLLQSQAKLVTALISPQAKSIGEYGISFGKVTMEAKALEMGILKVGESVAKLTDAQKAQVKYAIIMEGADSNIASLNDYLETNTAKLEKNKAAWKDLQTTVGQVFLPFIPTITAAMTWLSKAVTMSKLFIAIWASFMGIIPNIFRGFASGEVTIKNLVAYAKFAFQNLREQWLKAFFPDIPAGASDFMRGILEKAGVGKFKDEPTASPQVFDDAAAKEQGEKYSEAVKEAEDKLADIMQEARDKRLDIERDYQQKLQDINLNYSQKLQDIALNTADKTADAQRDYADKIADINKDTEQKKQDARAEAHKKEVDAETKYQDELKKLKEKYLMDLEDALHDRDARQILRIMRQYQVDKNALAENRQKEKQEAQADLAQKIQQAEAERKEKTEQAKRDLATKLRDIKIAADRERRDAAINHNRQLQDAAIAHRRALEEHRIYLQRKLRDLAEALQQEYNLTAAGQQAINNLLSSGYASASSPASVNAGTYQAPASSVYTSSTPTTSSTWAQAGMYGTTGLAEGGTFLATRPATINVAENRPEMITATPLGKPGRDISKVFTNGGGGMGGSGQIEIAMTLSPDLEARIVSNTLNETANIVTRINRSKS